MKKINSKSLGCGVGLRSEHYPKVTGDWPKMDWFEAITENYLDTKGRPLAILEQVRTHYPVGLHGVAMSIGSADPANLDYLNKLKSLIARIEPAIVSDHLCFSSVKRRQLFDLLPLPFTEEALNHVVARIDQIQNFLGRRILIENVSSYVTFKHSTIPEWEFLAEASRRSGCGILLDLNNVYVNSFNHGFDPYTFIRNIPAAAVGQFHLAGHSQRGDFLFDTHNAPVIEKVWDLYREALKLFGPVTTLIEWDADIPDFERLSEEAARARKEYEKVLSSSPEFLAGDPRLKSQGDDIEFRESSLDSASQNDKSKESLANKKTQELLSYETWFMNQILPSEPGFDRSLILPSGPEAAERMAVYREGYVARHEESLRETYQAVEHLAGHGRFHELVNAYSQKYLHDDYNLNHVGRHLPEFLRDWEGSRDLPFLSDLARLELSISECFHSAMGPPFRAEDAAAVPAEIWAEARLLFQPVFRIVASEWPILDLWRARKTPLEEISIQIAGRPQWVIVSRRGLDVHVVPADPLEYKLLTHFMLGKTLGETLEDFAAEIPDPSALTRLFSTWIASGYLSGYEIKQSAGQS